MWEPQLITCPCGQVFEQHRHRQKYCRPEHRPNPPRPHRHQLATAARGYGREHQLRRKAGLAALKPGTPCPRCGDEMHPDQELHLDHDDNDRNVYLGLTHARCNTSAANRRRKRPWWQWQRKQLAFPVEELLQAAAVARSRQREQARKQRNRELGEQARAMRARGMGWQYISDALGLSGPGRAYERAVYIPERQAKRGQAA